jgi:hypothetical protein
MKTYNAEDFGVQWFANGSSINHEYLLIHDGKVIAKHIDTTGKPKVAVVHIAPDVHGTDIIYWIRFSTNAKKGELNIPITK